jgi:hypothetical protein
VENTVYIYTQHQDNEENRIINGEFAENSRNSTRKEKKTMNCSGKRREKRLGSEEKNG